MLNISYYQRSVCIFPSKCDRFSYILIVNYDRYIRAASMGNIPFHVFLKNEKKYISAVVLVLLTFCSNMRKLHLIFAYELKQIYINN